MKFKKVLLERKTELGIITTVESIPDNPDINVGAIISMDEKNTEWTVVRIIEEFEVNMGE